MEATDAVAPENKSTAPPLHEFMAPLLLGHRRQGAAQEGDGMAQTWFKWAYGKELREMSDNELAIRFQRVWDLSDMDQIPAFQAEMERRRNA